MSSYPMRASLFAACLAPACAPASPPPAAPPVAVATAPEAPPAASAVFAAPPARWVALGDLHGDLAQAQATLRLAGLIDAEARWIGGDAWLIQTGDITDRGPDSRALIHLLRDLGPQAEAAGGKVVALLGNHEVMNLHGDLRYVHPGDYAQFGGPEARAAALGPGGDEGRWLRERAAVAQVGDTVFVHGGVAPQWATRGVDGLNAAVAESIARGGGEVTGDSGPLWLRAYVQAPEADACPALEQALATLGAKRMVVGHTTRRDGRIEARCGGRLAVIDIGIAAHYGGHIGYWERVGDDARAVYPSGPIDLPDP